MYLQPALRHTCTAEEAQLAAQPAALPAAQPAARCRVRHGRGGPPQQCGEAAEQRRRSKGISARCPAAGVQLRSPQAAPPRTPHADRRVKLPHQAAGGGKKRTRRSLAGSAVLDSPPFQTSDGFGRSTIGARFVLCIASITTRWRPPCPAPADARRAPPCAAGRPFHRGASAPPSDRGP